MISSFFATVRNDAEYMYQKLSQSKRYDNNTSGKLAHIAVRIFSTAMMGLALIHSIYKLPRLSLMPANTVMHLSLSALVYAIGHDIFTISQVHRPSEENPNEV